MLRPFPTIPFPEETPPDDGRVLLDGQAANLARELASDIHPADAVLARYGFSGPADPIWVALSQTAAFRALLDTACREWNAVDSTKARVRAKALASVEMAIPEWHRTMLDPVHPAGIRSDLAKLMVSVAQAGQVSGTGVAADAGGGFKLNIVINNGEAAPKVVTVSAPILDARAEEVS